MTRRTTYEKLLFVIVGCCLVFDCAGLSQAWPNPARQGGRVEAGNPQFDPLKSLTRSFPGAVTLKQKGRLLEFCPDNTCHGFVASSDVSGVTLKDFAFLYVYFFSEYIYLPEWRSRPEARDSAERVLSRPEYHNCKTDGNREAARCVLMDLARNGKIKLIFVRYDEGRRNIVPEDIFKELSKKEPVRAQ